MRNKLMQAQGEPYPPGLLLSAADVRYALLHKVDAAVTSTGLAPDPYPPPKFLAWLEDLVHLDQERKRVLIDGGLAEIPGELVAATVTAAAAGALWLTPMADVKQQDADGEGREVPGGGAGHMQGGTLAVPGGCSADVAVILRKDRGDQGGSFAGKRVSQPTTTFYSAPLLFDPGVVGANSTIRAEAEANFLSCMVHDADGIGSEGAHALLTAVRASGRNGVTQSLAIKGEVPWERGDSARAAAAINSAIAHGLIRRLPGYDEQCLVAAEHSQGLVHRLSSPAVAGLHGAAREIPLHPWLDHEGQTNKPMLSALLRRY